MTCQFQQHRIHSMSAAFCVLKALSKTEKLLQEVLFLRSPKKKTPLVRGNEFQKKKLGKDIYLIIPLLFIHFSSSFVWLKAYKRAAG